MCYTCTVYFPSVALPVGDVFLWFIVAFSLEFVTWCPVKQLANICKPLSLSNQNVFNVEVKFESFYGQTFNLKVFILKEHVRKHGPKKCARKPFWTVLCRNVQKKPNSSEPFWTVLNRFLGEGLRKPFWTVLWGVTFSPENRSEPFFVHPKVAFLSCCFELYVSIYFSFSDVRYLSAYGQMIEHIIIYQILSC